jgi:hypothetical protein
MHNGWIGVRASAVLAIIGSLGALLLAALMLWAAFFGPAPEGPVVPPVPLKVLGIAMAIIFGGLAGWGLVTGIAIFRRRAWARISILVFAVLMAFMCAGGMLAVLIVQLPSTPEAGPRIMTIVRWGMAAFYGALTAIGVWWLVLFNTKHTKEYFAGSEPGQVSLRPLSITMIAWFLLLGAVMLALGAVIRVPAMLFGLLITGWGALGVYTVYAAIQIYLGAGLLQLHEPARVGTIAYFVFGALNSLVTLTLPGFAGRMQEMQNAMSRFIPAGTDSTAMENMWIYMVIGAAFWAVPIWFLVRRRAAFR